MKMDQKLSTTNFFISMKLFYLFAMVIATDSFCNCQEHNFKFVCKYRIINEQPPPALPNIMKSIMECCGNTTCGGISVLIGSKSTIDTIKPEWFTHRILVADTIYLIKKRQSFITKEPAANVNYKLPANFTEGVEVVVSVTPFTLFSRFRMRLQATNTFQILLMDVRREYRHHVNQIILKWKMMFWNATTDTIWKNSIAPDLDPFPFTSDVSASIAFKNINDTIQIKVNGISYVFYKSLVPNAWANEFKIEDDAYLNSVDFYGDNPADH